MRKQQLKVIANLATIFLLCITLLISISFGWYTNNKEVNANGMFATTATDNLVVTNQGAYSTQIGKDEPSPNEPTDNKEVTGVLAGEIVYFSISISSADNASLSLNDLKIAVSSIFGDEYFTEPPVEYTAPTTEGAYNLLEPTDANKVSTYVKKDRVIHSILRYINPDNTSIDYYISKNSDGDYILNVVTVSASGDVTVTSTRTLTDTEYTTYSGGIPTGHKYVCDEVETYTTYKDPSNNKEYYSTYVDGVHYIHYIYETDSGSRRYNMIDIYSYELYKVHGRNDLEDDTLDAYTTIYTSPSSAAHANFKKIKFPKADGKDKSISMFTLYDPTYFTKYCGTGKVDNMTDAQISDLLDTAEDDVNHSYKELTFVFKFVFNYDDYKTKINTSSVSYREIKFNNVIISLYDPKEGGNS